MTGSAATEFPAELFASIITFFEPQDASPAILSLTRAIPQAPIPIYRLFEHISLVRRDQPTKLYQRVIKYPVESPLSPRTWVKTLSVESFEVDADACLNLIRSLSCLKRLSLHVGPRNFSPEHLEELFEKPILGLEYLALRFRPYLQKVNHYQFLKGSYFDTLLRSLANWPRGCLPVLSIVQDPLDPELVPRNFAQPIVFFQLGTYLSSLVRSEAMCNITALRMRIPFRPVAAPLANGHVSASSDPSCAWSLTFLDLSTCHVVEDEVEILLTAFHHAQHLVLDKCAVLKGELREGEWAALGKRCALVGARRAKLREKAIKAILDRRHTEDSLSSSTSRNAQAKRAKKGRKGLATATISLRETEESGTATSQVVQNPDRDKKPLKVASPTASLQKIRVLPPAPNLRGFCTTITTGGVPNNMLGGDVAGGMPLPVNDHDDGDGEAAAITGPTNEDNLSHHLALKHAFIRAEFAKGWEEGLSQLRNHRKRLRDSWKNESARVMRFSDNESSLSEDNDDNDEDVLVGLLDIPRLPEEPSGSDLEELEGIFSRFEREDYDAAAGGSLPCPVICLAGDDDTEDELHAEGCSHRVGQKIFTTCK